jgi:hypothetical protein
LPTSISGLPVAQGVRLARQAHGPAGGCQGFPARLGQRLGLPLLNQTTATVRRSDAVAAMGEIDRSSRQITQIIGEIDEIAFQTNRLALLAAVRRP